MRSFLQSELMLSLIFLVGAIMFIFSLISLYPMIQDSTHCVVKVDGAVWFEGKAYAVECRSQGDATQCSKRGEGFFSMHINKGHVVSKNVVAECK